MNGTYRVESPAILIISSFAIFPQHTVEYIFGFMVVEKKPQQIRADSISSRVSRKVRLTLILSSDDSGHRFQKVG